MSKQEKEIFDGSTNFQKTQYLISAQQAWNYNYPVSGHKDHIHISIRK